MVIALRNNVARGPRVDQAVERVDERGEGLRGEGGVREVLHHLAGHQAVPHRVPAQHHQQPRVPRGRLLPLPQLHPKGPLHALLQQDRRRAAR